MRALNSVTTLAVNDLERSEANYHESDGSSATSRWCSRRPLLGSRRVDARLPKADPDGASLDG